MNLLKDEIIGLVVGKGDAKISSKFQELLNEAKYKKFCEDIPEIIEKKVLFPDEGESYFDDLHSFYLSRKVVARFVFSLLGTDKESASSMTNRFSEDFIAEYPQHKIFKMRVKELLETSANIIIHQIKENGLVTEDQEIALFIAQNSKEILEGQNRLEVSMRGLKNQMNGIQKNIAEMAKQLENIQKDSDKNVASVLTIGQLTDDTEYAGEVKRIETEIQQKMKFSEAIIKYNELISDIKENGSDQNELLTHIYINLALCYANTEEYVRAEKSLGYAQKYCEWEKNAKFHYVKGYICWKEDKKNIEKAIELLDIAIALEPKHFHARMLRCQLGSFIGEEKEKILATLSEAEEQIVESKDRGDLYEVKGLIYKAYGEYDLAEEWMLKADQENHSIENLINLGILYYCRATVNNEHEKRLLKIKIDYPEIFKAFECFQKVKQEITYDELQLYKHDFVEVYISTCILSENPEQIENIQIEDKVLSTLDYETQKTLIFHEAIKGNNVSTDLLSEEDKKFLLIVEKAESGKTEEAFQLVLDSIYYGTETDLERKYNFALQLSLELNHLDRFKQLRKELIKDKIECPYLELYDAEYYDSIGETEKSKEFYDSHIHENDGLYLLNAILFYRTHSYDFELKQAYCIAVKKISNREIAVHRTDKIIQDAFSFFAAYDINLALDMLNVFDKTVISTKCFQNISEVVYSKVMNVRELINIYEGSFETHKSFEQRINYIILLKYDLQFDRAKEEAEKMISLCRQENRERQIKFFELLSELCLFTGDMDKSVEYITAAKDLAQDLVFDPIHQLYMTRTMRCGKHDGLGYGIEFKRTHPNVVNWLQEFQAIEKNEQGEEVLADEFKEIIDNQKKRFDIGLNYYKKQSVSFYQLQRLLGSDLLALLSIPDCYNVKFVIGPGNIEKIDEQGKCIKEKVVIDAMTLMFIKCYDILEVLDDFAVVYVTYSSIEELEKLFIQFGVKLIDDLISWLKSDLRVELYPNYSMASEEEALFHPGYFMDSLEAAKREKCHFLCIDARSPLFFPKDVDCFINIMSLIHREVGDKSSILVTKLLTHNVTFINFRADDIVYSLSNEVEEKVFSKFFAIDCSCDSNSYLSVYHLAILKVLSVLGEDKLDKLLIQICKQIDITFSRARMCKWRMHEYESVEESIKYQFYVKHNMMLLFMLHDVFIDTCKFWNRICKYDYKYFNVSILEKIHRTNLDNTNRADVAEELVGYYSF